MELMPFFAAVIIIIGPIIVVSAIFLISYILECSIFQYERNPYRRTCKKCGAQQDLTEFVGSRMMWWEESYPIGNDPSCKCHSYAEYHS